MKDKKELEALDAWLLAVPDDPYDLCPCGCGKKWRYIVKGGEAEIKIHAEIFMKNYVDGLNKKG